MAYVSLYRKWRPQTFMDVVGQTHVIRTLENSLNNQRVSHAYLFAGPRGTGKTTVARLFAKGLNCSDGPSASFCGECNECISISQGNSLNVIEIDGASNRGIEEIRELREQVRYAPADGRYKIYIIDEVHMLTPEAFNALLKTLEEPPAHVVFVIATTDPQKIPATILSRCQRYDFKRFSIEQICERLRKVLTPEGIQAEGSALEIVAEHAQGGMRDALGILDQCLAYSDRINPDTVSEVLGVATHETINQFVQLLDKKDTTSLFQVIQELYVAGKDLPQFVRDLLQHLRRCMLDASNLSKAGISWDKGRLLEVIQAFTHCEREMRYSTDVNIPMELTILHLIDIPSELESLQTQIADLQAQLTSLETSGITYNSSNGSTPEKSTADNEKRPQVSLTKGDNQEKLKQISENWGEFLQTLRNERLVQPEAFLREGFPLKLSNNVLIIGFPKERGFHRASIEQEKHKEPAERLMAKFFGSQLSIECVTAEADQYKETSDLGSSQKESAKRSGSNSEDTSKKPAKEEVKASKSPAEEKQVDLDESVSAALRIFGGKIIEIKDN